MLLKIVQTGAPVLRQKARTLSPDEIRGAEVQALIELMRETMRDAPGVGLAAPQIGESLQLAVIEDQITQGETDRKPVPFHVIVNPTLHLGVGDPIEHFEGCLSVEGYHAVVPRAPAVTVSALDHRGQPITIEASGWYARILQHEIDHLNGTLYIDRMRTRTYSNTRNFLSWWQGRTPADVRAAVGDAAPPVDQPAGRAAPAERA
jgi:peptide deformylase